MEAGAVLTEIEARLGQQLTEAGQHLFRHQGPGLPEWGEAGGHRGSAASRGRPKEMRERLEWDPLGEGLALYGLRERFGPASVSAPGQRRQGLALAPGVPRLDGDGHQRLAPRARGG